MAGVNARPSGLSEGEVYTGLSGCGLQFGIDPGGQRNAIHLAPAAVLPFGSSGRMNSRFAPKRADIGLKSIAKDRKGHEDGGVDGHDEMTKLGIAERQTILLERKPHAGEYPAQNFRQPCEACTLESEILAAHWCEGYRSMRVGDELPIRSDCDSLR